MIAPVSTGKLSEPVIDTLLTRLCEGGFQQEAEQLRGHIRAVERPPEQPSLEIDGQAVTGWRGKIVIERRKAPNFGAAATPAG